MNRVSTRREFVRMSAAALLASRLSALEGQETKRRRARNCIVLWMAGGPSHVDTWDLKGYGPAGTVDTPVPGIKISEWLPLVAKEARHLAIIRSMTSKEEDHDRATVLMHTGHLPAGGVEFPTLGSVASRHWRKATPEVPLFVDLGGHAGGAGFLGVNHAPVSGVVANAGTARDRLEKRLKLLEVADQDFSKRSNTAALSGDKKVRDRALELLGPKAAEAFDVGREEPKVREA